MKALVYHGSQNVTIDDIPVPKPAYGELLLKTAAAGVCFSDKHAYEYGGSYYRSGIVLGHEGCARVAGMGEGVEGWETGELVAVNTIVYCGRCVPCQLGLQTQCVERVTKRLGSWIGLNALRDETTGTLYNGLFAEFCAVPAMNCYRLPKAVDAIAGANVEPYAVGLHAVRTAGVMPGDNVVFMGLDDYTTGAMKFIPLANRIVVDPIPVRQELARKLGVEYVLDPTQGNVVRELQKLLPFGADLVFVCSEDYVDASLQYPTQAHRVVRPCGTVVVTRFYNRGNPGDGIAFSYMKEARIVESGTFAEKLIYGGKARSDYQMVIDAFAGGKVDAKNNVSRVIPFSELSSKADVDALYATLPEKETKIVVTME